MTSSSACSPFDQQKFPDEAVLTAAVDRQYVSGAGYEAAKRLIDVVGALFLLTFGLPLLGTIALGVKFTSRGPVLFAQRRLGRRGEFFQCFKFRTMVADAEARLSTSQELSAEFEANYKIKNDPRVTRVGAFLRRTSLDELPQLWNVVRGEMSLVGPRPIIEPELVKYGADAGRLVSVKPGLGGLWQVSGRSDTTYAERVAMDMTYIDSRSLALDLRLLLKTAVVVLRGRGAY